MAKDTNPIKYSDLIQPDDAINSLIAQLKQLDETYAQSAKDIREEAAKLSKELKNASGATEEGRKATRAAATDADRLAAAQEKLTRAQSENAMELEEVNQAIREANQLNKLQVKLNKSAEGSYDRLSAQYSINKIRLNAMSKEMRQNTEEGRQLETQSKEIYEEMKRLQEATGKHQLNVGNYPDMTNAIDSLGDKMLRVIGLDGKFGSSLMGLAKGGKQAGKGLDAVAKSSNKATNSLEDVAESGGEATEAMGEVAGGGNALVGVFQGIGAGAKALGKTLLGLLKNPVFLAIAGIGAAGATFKWWYDYNSGLQEATRLTKQFTDKSGEDLKNFRNEVQVVADTFGKDFREVLIANNAVAKQFGISQEESLKLIRQGFISGADANGEFLDSLREYPAYFREAGLSAEAFMAIVTQNATSGIYSDKGVDAIKDANIRLREMTTSTADALDAIGISSDEVQKALQDGSKTTFDIMKEVSAKLAEMPESAKEVGTAIADIFGGPGEDAGYQYIATLKDIQTEMDVLVDKTGEWGELQERQMQSQLELQNALAALFDSTDGSFESMKANFKIWKNELLTGVLNGIRDVVNGFVEWHNSSVLLRGVIYGISHTLQFLFSTLVYSLNLLYDLLAGLVKMLEGIVTFDWSRAEAGIVQFGNAIPNAVENIADAWNREAGELSADLNKKLNPLTIEPKVEINTTGAVADLQKKTDDELQQIIDTFNEKVKAKRLSVEIKKVDLDFDLSEMIPDYDKKQTEQYKQIEELLERGKRPMTTMERAQYVDDLMELLSDPSGLLIAQYGNKKHILEEINNLLAEIEEYEDIINKATQQKEDNRKKREAEERKARAEKEMKEQEQALKEWADRKRELLRQYEDVLAEGGYSEAGKKFESELGKMLHESDMQFDRTIEDLEARIAELRADTTNKYAQEEIAILLKLIEQYRIAKAEAATEIAKTYEQTQYDATMEAFDLQQRLAQSEFDLLKKTEEEKTRYKLQAEIDRWNKVLEVNKTMSEAERQIIANTIKKLQQDIDETYEKNAERDIYDVLGFDLSEDAKYAADQAMSYATDALNEWANARVNAAQLNVDKYAEEVEAAQRAVELEKEARANGYASDVATAEKELANAKKLQARALEEQKRAQREQAIINAATQVSDLITASAKIWKDLGFPGALAALSVMWGSFAYSKIKASEVATEAYGEGTVELLKGGSHASGRDIDLGTKPDGTRRRAEGGEFFAVINKRNSRKYRAVIPNLINAMNDGTLERYLSSFNGSNLNVTVSGRDEDLRGLGKDVRAIRVQGERREVADGNGRIVYYKNLKRRVV